MEAPDYCFAFNFLRANGTSTAGGCHPREASTHSPPHTHPKSPLHSPPPALPSCFGYIQILSRGGGSLRGRGRLRTADIGPKRFVYPGPGSAQGRGAVGTACRGLRNLIFPRRKSTATASPEPDIRKKMMASVEAGQLGSVLLLASFRE